MEQPYFKKLPINVCFVLICTAIIIHSCKKDNSAKWPIKAPGISDAKAWYESKYPASLIPTGKLAIHNDGSNASAIFDYTKHIKPDWQHGASYTRYNTGVVELPMDPASDKISSAFKNINSSLVYKQQYSRSSFLLLYDGIQYQAYVMTIIADSAYLKNDLSKLNLTTYRKHDPDFSGVVVYFTPDGKFVSSYGYKNGEVIPALPAGSTSSQTTQNINTGHLKTAEAAVPNCLAWYLDTYIDGELVTSIYLYTTCAYPDDSTPPSGSSPSAIPCTPPAPPPAGVEAVRFRSDVAQPSPTPVGGDGGLPPPVPVAQPCPVAPPVGTPPDPCAQLSQVNSLAQNAVNVNLDHQIFNTLGTGNEYGTDENLAVWPANGTYLNSTLSSNYAESNLTANFTWNATNGYTINIAHSHPNGGAPSPADVFKLFVNSNNTDLTNAGAAAVNYYKNNASITVITSNGTYVVKGANYGTLATLYSQYKVNISGFNNNYEKIAGDHSGSTEYALLSIFGSSINLYKAGANSSTFSVITIDKNGTVTVTPCPVN